jgi:hypothetical protein
LRRLDGRDLPRRNFPVVDDRVVNSGAETSFKRLSTYLTGVANHWPSALVSSLVLVGAWAGLLAIDIAQWSPGLLLLIPLTGVVGLLFYWRKQRTVAVVRQDAERLRGRVQGSLVLEGFELVRESDGGVCSHLTSYLQFGNRGTIPIEYSMRVLSLRIEGEDNSAIPAPVTGATFHVWPGQQDTFTMSVVLGVGVAGPVTGLIHYVAEYWAPTFPERFTQRKTYRFVNVPAEDSPETTTEYWPVEQFGNPILSR